LGFQITFFRSRVEAAQGNPSALAAKHLVMAHVALSDPTAQRQWHEQRLARASLGLSSVSTEDTAVHLRDWSLSRQAAGEASRYTARLQAQSFGLDLSLVSTQRVLLQGAEGISRKGPLAGQFSHYYSQPQLAVQGTLTRKTEASGAPLAVTGRAWLDHEWSDAYLPPGAVGWDWIGMNLHDGSALMAFRMRRKDGSTLWAGGSFRAPGRATQAFPASEVHFKPGRTWQSPGTGARYPVQWVVETPVGRFEVRARFEAQELDDPRGTGTIYWEGLSALLNAQGREVGSGYLEMTGYAGSLSL
jgi:predicted secreted hydrolase